MTLVSVAVNNPLIDGRQSDRAMMIRRGVQILLAEMRFAILPELTLSNGRRADLIALSDKGEIWIVEIKSSVEDFSRRPEMAGLSSLLRPIVFCHPRRCASRDLPGRLRPLSIGWVFGPPVAGRSRAPPSACNAEVGYPRFFEDCRPEAHGRGMGGPAQVCLITSGRVWPVCAAVSGDAC